jgi:hypothetical protein
VSSVMGFAGNAAALGWFRSGNAMLAKAAAQRPELRLCLVAS